MAVMDLRNLVLLIALFYAIEAQKCEPPCCFENEDGIFNITTLGTNGEKAEFQMLPLNVTGRAEKGIQHKISYNPCRPYTDPLGNPAPAPQLPCKEVAACRHIVNGSIYTQNSFGSQNFLNVSTKKDQLTINYSAVNETEDKYTLTVEFNCDPKAATAKYTSVEYLDQNINTTKTIMLKIDTVCACVNGCVSLDDSTTAQPNISSTTAQPNISSTTAQPIISSTTAEPPPPEEGGLSTGTILLIVFVVLVFVYIFGGILYNKLVAGAEGVELFPHHEFWTSLPGLIFDGIRFACSCCRSKSRTSYDNM